MNKKISILLLALFTLIGTSIGVAEDLNQRYSPVVKKTNKSFSPKRTPDWAPRYVNETRNQFPVLGSGIEALPKANPMEAPMRISPSGSTLQGLRYVSTDPSFKWASWYELSTDGTETELWDLPEEVFVEGAGFVRGDYLYAFYGNEFWGMIFVNWTKYDLRTGQIVEQQELDSSNFSNWVLTAVYDEELDVAYAYTYNANGTGALLQKFDFETNTFTVLNNSPGLVDNRMATWAYYPKDGGIYGVNLYGNFMKMNKETGEFDYVAGTGVVPGPYVQAMVYSPLDHAFIWTAIHGDQSSCIYSIDPETGKAYLLHEFEYVNQYIVLSTPDKVCDDNAPGLVQFNSMTFNKDELTGVGEIVLPTTKFSGDLLINQEVYYKVQVDGETKLTNQVGISGETHTFELTVTEGLHEITVIPYFKDGYKELEGHPVSKEVFAGNDTPKAPVNVTINQQFVTWDPVPERGANEGYVDQSAVYYNVYVNGEKQNTEPVYGSQYEINIEDAPMAFFQAEVEAVYKDKVSKKGVSAETIIGHAFTVPYFLEPTEEDCRLMTFVDNGLGGYWRYDEDYEGLTHVTSSTANADDWVFLPVTQFDETESLYEITYDATARLGNFPETYEVTIGKTPTAADAKVLFTETLTNEKEFATKKVVFEIEEPGEYYIGFHCISPANMFYMYIRDITVSLTDKVSDCPAKCDNLEAIAAPEGELKATVKFTMPTKTISGKSLLTMGGDLTATVKSSVETKTVTARAGAPISVDIATEQGINEIAVYVSNSFGDGEEILTQLFTGEDAPTIVPVIAEVSDDNYTMTLYWVHPTVGAKGGYINPDNLVYTVYRVNDSSQWEAIDQVSGGITEYSYSIRRNSRLTYERLGITVSNAYGSTSEVSYAAAIIGKPYELPMIETFPGQLTYDMVMEQHPDDSYTGAWEFVDPAIIDANIITESSIALIGYPRTYGTTYGRIALPKFSTKGLTNVEFRLNCYFANFTPKIDVLVCHNSDEETVIGTVDSTTGAGWQTISFKLPEQYLDREWVYVAVRAEYNGTEAYAIIGGYSIRNMYAQDLAVNNIDGPSSVLIGDAVSYKVKIENVGLEAMQIPAIYCDAIDANGELITNLEVATEPDQTSLEPGENCIYEYEYIPEPDHLGNVTIKAYIEGGDMDPSNDAIESLVKVNKTNDPVVTDLKANVSEDLSSVELTWSAPVLSLELDDFENLESFDYSNELGQWKNIDGDEKVNWIFSGWEYPDMGTPKAYQVFNYNDIYVAGSSFAPYSGNQYLIAICPEDASAADDWLISPEIKGGSGISFYWNIVNPKYSPEKIEVMYSSTTQDPEAFTLVETIQKKRAGWEMVTVSFPEDAKYFALHYVSADKFGAMIDYLSYAPITSTAEIIGYNVYRDGVMIAEKVTSTSFVDTNVEAAEDYRYNVTVVVSDQGVETEYAKSNTVNVSVVGIFDILSDKAIYAINNAIVINGFIGQEAIISTIDGKVVASQVINDDKVVIPVENDIYVVKVGNTINKIIVK